MTKLKSLLYVVLTTLTLSACASPEQAQNNREEQLKRMFSNPADRVGMYTVMKQNDHFWIDYIPSQVSQEVAVGRLDQLCQRTAMGTYATVSNTGGTRSTRLGDGRSIIIENVIVKCVK